MYTRPIEPLDRVDREALRRARRWCSTRTSPRSRPGYNFGETAELFDHPYEVKPAQLPPGTYRNITGNVALSYGLVAARAAGEAADLLRVVPDHAGVRHPARAVEAQELRRAHAAGRGRDRRGRRRDRRRVRRAARRHRHERSRRRPQVGGDRPRDQPRAAAAARRRAARRPVDRPADQDRAGRPAARDVRPPRRGAAADRRRAVAEPTASTPRSRRCASR